MRQLFIQRANDYKKQPIGFEFYAIAYKVLHFVSTKYTQ